ncbi:MAG: vanadium-dependent haloperoxidase [Acidobacteriota bacterium]
MNNHDRRQEALRVRIAAAELAAARPHPRHIANTDEQRFRRPRQDDPSKNEPSYLMSFTKGLPHEPKTGLVARSADFQQFVKAIDSGDPQDFRDTPLGPPPGTTPQNPHWGSDKANDLPFPLPDGSKVARVRAWESQGAGNTFDLEGPDAQAETMPPAPPLGSDELTAEMAEVYAQALLRDMPFTLIKKVLTDEEQLQRSALPRKIQAVDTVAILEALERLPWFADPSTAGLTDAEASRKRPLDDQTFFRGITPGDDVGPYISQFMLVGNGGINGNDDINTPDDGLITYGAVTINQRVRFAKPLEDHMTNWAEWLDVQNGADLRGQESYRTRSPYRFIATPRDLATYVHYDALYEAYLNACLLMLGMGVPFDPDIPFQNPDAIDRQQGFAHFGGPHILSLVTEVATRALKAVRFQKFNVHRRLRPEGLGGRLSQFDQLRGPAPELAEMVEGNADFKIILDMIAARNGDATGTDANYLLPMAFCEGSPMHPAYGAGHATVAGACVTILKAFFDHAYTLDKAYVPLPDGSELQERSDVPPLTVEGELNKLASNISIGRNWAGVHYFTDYIESIRMGEQIAIGILEEQKLTYGENFSMTVPLFDGDSIRI